MTLETSFDVDKVILRVKKYELLVRGVLMNDKPYASGKLISIIEMTVQFLSLMYRQSPVT